MTFLTADLRRLLDQILASLAGESGYHRVRKLRTAFGGGGSHGLAALLHSARSPEAFDLIADAKEFVRAKNVEMAVIGKSGMPCTSNGFKTAPRSEPCGAGWPGKLIRTAHSPPWWRTTRIALRSAETSFGSFLRRVSAMRRGSFPIPAAKALSPMWPVDA